MTKRFGGPPLGMSRDHHTEVRPTQLARESGPCEILQIQIAAVCPSIYFKSTVGLAAKLERNISRFVPGAGLR